MKLDFNQLRDSFGLIAQLVAHGAVGLAILLSSTEAFAEIHAEAHIVTFQSGQLLCAERFRLTSNPTYQRGRFAVVSAQLLPLRSDFSEAEKLIISELTHLESPLFENCETVAQLVSDSGTNFGFLYGRVSVGEIKNDHRVGNCTILTQTVEMQILQPGSVNFEDAEVRMTLSATNTKMECNGL